MKKFIKIIKRVKNYKKISFKTHYKNSIETPTEFWTEQSKNIDWFENFNTCLDSSNIPFYKWFKGGKLNVCYNAIDVLFIK
jgi:hypothetical protein